MREKWLTPPIIVKELGKYIIGQDDAKRAVAIALRNRWRRQKLPPKLRDEVAPKNIIMIGPTGIGKTEIARRLAQLAQAPFIKVEASKYTEVGYVGRDVESMVRDLTNLAVHTVKMEMMKKVREKAKRLTEERLLNILLPLPQSTSISHKGGELEEDERIKKAKNTRKRLREKLKNKELEDRLIEIKATDKFTPMIEIFSSAGVEQMGMNFQDLLGDMLPKRPRDRKAPIKEARQIILEEESQKLVDKDKVIEEAIRRAENSGIIFIDEIDKVAGGGGVDKIDVSREGVQRDLLPIVEGTTVATRYGAIKSDHILFIAAGAFHATSPSDLIPELQGRFPIRVELNRLTQKDFERILTEPENALIKQYQALMKTEGIQLTFEESAVKEIAHLASLVNERSEDIGARRLYTVMEKLLEDISFNASKMRRKSLTIASSYVKERLKDIVESEDLSRYIL
ncbi:ATP-dependent protease ATPase subunit HslU [Candidatus Aerophobetes bacterium]|uniref:ATP-dependent protease ATPase subunit HslU n=1 Tax=Aerophobetes bacterium TaxID=2030807 RepID=A0A523YPA4_UNCAE|nr:MAG: ATP-dependent protease ATPase subunit HslU [Candidatus Aerophobetes bacterium]